MCGLLVKKYWPACLTALLIGLNASAAQAEICFLPSGTCVDSSIAEVECDSSYSLTSRKSGDHWVCDRCGGKYYCYCASNYTENDGKCVYDEAHDKCPSSEYTLSTDLGDGYACKKCDDKSSAQYGKYKCDDAAEKCKNAGYAYAKTDNNTCEEKCPDGDYYKTCTCEGYNETSDDDKCYIYKSCDLGDGKTTYYKQENSKKKCTNSDWVTTSSPQYDSDRCSLVCTEECEDNKKYYSCSGNDNSDEPYSWRDTEKCAKPEWKDTPYCKKPVCTIQIANKHFTKPFAFEKASALLPTQGNCDDDKFAAGLGLNKSKCIKDSKNVALIRYCGSLSDVVSVDDLNIVANEAFGYEEYDDDTEELYEVAITNNLTSSTAANFSWISSIGEAASNVYSWYKRPIPFYVISLYKRMQNNFHNVLASSGLMYTVVFNHVDNNDSDNFYMGGALISMKGGAAPTYAASTKVVFGEARGSAGAPTLGMCVCSTGTGEDYNGSSCGAEYNLNYIPTLGKCTKCGTERKAKCDAGTATKFGTTGQYVCYDSNHPCHMMNYSNCQENQVAPSQYIDLNESCPSGAPKKIGPITLFNDSVFRGTPFYNMQCYHCEKNDDGSGGSGGCSASTYTARISCTLAGTAEYHSDCPGQHGVGLFNCQFNIPDCAFSAAGVYDSSGNRLYGYGAGSGSTTVASCKLNGTCRFFVSGGTLTGTASLTSNGNGTWSCSYTKNKGQY